MRYQNTRDRRRKHIGLYITLVAKNAAYSQILGAKVSITLKPMNNFSAGWNKGTNQSFTGNYY